MRKPITVCASLLALFTLVSCSGNKAETLEQLSARVFDRAEIQFKDLNARLDSVATPRSFENGKAIDSPAKWWCSGFFPGSLWYVYKFNGKEDIKQLAWDETHKLDGILSFFASHDIGFQVNSSFGNAYRFTDDEQSRQMVVDAAEKLAARYSPVTKVIRSWDFVAEGRDWQYPVIIDNMMNLELLLYAWQLSGNESFKDIAVQHARTTMANHFREDYTTFHVVDYDAATGAARRHETYQGYSDESAWARGQAWALYGYTMMYRYTGMEEFLEQAGNVAEMIIGYLPENGIPYWDFNDPDIPQTNRDASAGAIMACGLIDLSRVVKDSSKSEKYLALAEKQVRTLASDEYLAESGTNGGFLLLHSVGAKPKNVEVDVPLTYADYYFLEAVLKLTGRL